MMTRTAIQNPLAAASYPAVRGPLLGGALLLALLVGIFFDFFQRQVLFAVRQPSDWGHTLVIPLIAGYFVYIRREQLRAKPFRTTWIGVVPIVLGVGWYMICMFGPQVLFHHNLHGFGVGLTLFGIVLLFTGFRAMTILWFPLLYLIVFGQTISDRFMLIITEHLQDYTSRGAGLMMKMIGIDVERDGNILKVYGSDGIVRPLNIAEACSGMRMLMAFLALGVAMAYTGLDRLWQRVVLVIMAAPTAIFVNILRVVSLGLLTLVNPDFAAGDMHSAIGLIWLVPAFLIYLGIMWIVRNIIVENEQVNKSTSQQVNSLRTQDSRPRTPD